MAGFTLEQLVDVRVWKKVVVICWELEYWRLSPVWSCDHLRNQLVIKSCSSGSGLMEMSCGFELAAADLALKWGCCLHLTHTCDVNLGSWAAYGEGYVSTGGWRG